MEAKRSAVVFAWLLLLPALLYITVIVAYPLVDTFILSFTDASLRKTTNWVGFINYEKIFNATFADVITRTFIWTFFRLDKDDHRHLWCSAAELRRSRPGAVSHPDNAAVDRTDGYRHLHVGLDV